MKHLFKLVIPILIITIVFGTMYIIDQQILRSDANDPQLQLSEAIAARINNGADPNQFVTSKTSATELAPFVIIYDKQGNEVASSVELNGHTPALPNGVLDHAKANHPNIVTWQPTKGVRIATVIRAGNNNYVLVGRSLREVENREEHLMILAAIGWLLSIATLGGGVLAHKYMRQRQATKYS